MPLPIPNLDDRKFQQIVDDMRRLIPLYCPEWTDHNVSDPGIALIELFAWMAEMLLYRVNQVPDKNYIKFLEMIGVKLDPPRAARAPVTFYLSAPQPNAVTIPKGTETATVRTETLPAVVFTTEADLTIRPPVLVGGFTSSAARGEGGWVVHDLTRLDSPGHTIILFPNPPQPNDAFHLALKEDHSQHVLALVAGCKHAGGAGIDPRNPPLEWEVWQGGAIRWAPCQVQQDKTGGFNEDGEIVLHLPAMAEAEFAGTRAYWLRCRVTDASASVPRYETSPEIERYLRVESRGGTMYAHHGITVTNEFLGYSEGTPGQVFHLLNTPVLLREGATDYLSIQPPGGQAERWEEVPDFGNSSERDRHYTLDELDGAITLGPSLLQPDGSVYCFGAIPPKGSLLTFSRYQYGGGIAGNVPKGAIAVLKSSIPYVSSVLNREHAIGGRDAQTLDDAKLRAAHHLRSRTRAVTAEDYEFHATRIPGIARALCLAPGAQPGDAEDVRPGQVFVIVLPQPESTDRPRPDQLVLSPELRASALKYLKQRSVLGIGLEVSMAGLTWVSVEAELRLIENLDPAPAEAVLLEAEDKLYRYLNPFLGGPQHHGWPFGRTLYLSELYGLLQGVPSVECVESIRVYIVEPGRADNTRPAPPQLTIPKHGVICSGVHRVTQARDVGLAAALHA